MKNIRVCENPKVGGCFSDFSVNFFWAEKGEKTRHKKYEYNKCQMKKEEEEEEGKK